jgi:Glycosyltransferase like family 2
MTSKRRLDRDLFWASATVVVATYVGFPLLVLLRARVSPRPVRSADVTPSLSVVIAAHNEQGGIGAKLESVLACDYPEHLRDVVVASDGSTDRTVEIAASFRAAGVRTLDLPRTGKAAALNVAVASCRSDIVVLSDANNPLDAAALRRIVRPFADPEVGGVAGDQRYLPSDGEDGSAGERSYWSIDRWVKSAESAAGSVISATGALYAVRRELFPTVVGGVTDDFWVSTQVICAGHRLVLAEDAVVYEVPAAKTGLEFQRKVRVMTRGLRGVYERRELLDARRHGFYSVQLLLHKVLRRLMVVPLAVMWGASLSAALRGSRGWGAIAAVQTAGYATGAAGLVVTVPGKVGRLVSLGSYFVMINAASAVAVWNLVRGRRITTWEPARSPGRLR